MSLTDLGVHHYMRGTLTFCGAQIFHEKNDQGFFIEKSLDFRGPVKTNIFRDAESWLFFELSVVEGRNFGELYGGFPNFHEASLIARLIREELDKDIYEDYAETCEGSGSSRVLVGVNEFSFFSEQVKTHRLVEFSSSFRQIEKRTETNLTVFANSWSLSSNSLKSVPLNKKASMI